ncbi:MAG: cyclic nucleotide-binding domain-containing protein [Actinomycetota bacterium]|nr:cyclic nucleotide-binding domain-containing protein [Actinomycetota bacterium]
MPREDIDLLASVALFEGLSKRELRAIARVAKQVHFPAGHDIVVEGETAAGFHLIAKGKATIVVGGRKRNQLGSGDYFGEISLIDGGPRSATVVAETDVTTLAISAWQFKPLLVQYPSMMKKMLIELCARLRSTQKIPGI